RRLPVPLGAGRVRRTLWRHPRRTAMGALRRRQVRRRRERTGASARRGRGGLVTLSDDKRCRAHNRQGQRCGRAATPGTTVCASHGSKAPAVKAAAQRRLALARAEAVVRNETARRGPLTLGDVYRELLDTAATVV